MALRTRFVLRDGINTPGGDGTTRANTGPNRAYESLLEARDSEVTAGADLVTLLDQIEIFCGGSVAETAIVNFNGHFTANQAYYVRVRPDVGNEHDLVRDITKYRIETVDTSVIWIEDNGIYLEGLQLFLTTDYSTTAVRLPDSANPTGEIGVQRCLIGFLGGTSINARGIADGGSGAYNGQLLLENNLVYGGFADGIDLQTSSPHRIAYNTIADVTNAGIFSGYGVGAILNNNLVFNAAYGGAVNAGSSHNAANDIAANIPGPNSVDLSAFAGTDIFANYVANDYKLHATGTGAAVLKDVGIAVAGITTDALGTVRPQNTTEDIGAHEFPSAAGAPVITGQPSTMARGEAGLQITGTDLGGATALELNTPQGAQPLTITGNTATTITFTVPVGMVGLYDLTGYTITVTTPGGTDTSAVVPYTPEAGRSFIDLVTPLFADDGYMLFGYEGTPAPVSTDQLEYDTVTSPSSIANTPGADSEWILASMPTVTETTDCHIIRALTGVRSAQWTITFQVITAPTVDAGGPYSGTVSTAIQLAATVTPGSDPTPALLWTIDSGGTGTFLPNATAEDPTFTPDQAGPYVLRLTVTPSDGPAVFDTANLTSNVAPVAPTVDAGGPYSGDVSTPISLNATVTPGTDPSPTFLWTIDSGGTGTFSNDAIEDPTFTPDQVGPYVLRLTVTPNDIAAVFDTANLTSNAIIVAPTVDAGGPYTGDILVATPLAATVTPGSDPAPTLLWEVVSGGTGTFLPNATAEDPTFTPDTESRITLRLIATPNDGPAVIDTAIFTTTNYVFISGATSDLILAVTGGPTINDGLLSFYLSNGATSLDIDDAENEFLLARGFNNWYDFLISVSVPAGHIDDMFYVWWSNGAPLI